jgi:hypothetical protein
MPLFVGIERNLLVVGYSTIVVAVFAVVAEVAAEVMGLGVGDLLLEASFFAWALQPMGDAGEDRWGPQWRR